MFNAEKGDAVSAILYQEAYAHPTQCHPGSRPRGWLSSQGQVSRSRNVACSVVGIIPNPDRYHFDGLKINECVHIHMSMSG